MLEQDKTKFDLQIAKEKEFAEEMAKRLEGVVCRIVAKVSEEDRLYGSVLAKDIIDALGKQDIKIEKRMILLKEPIKNIGTYKIPIRIYKEVEPEITVEVFPDLV
jgi:large subunit ribosomal protein L9